MQDFYKSLALAAQDFLHLFLQIETLDKLNYR